jgi:hypothetical protein
MKRNFGVIRCSFHSNSWETNKAVPKHLQLSPEEAPHSEENPSKTSTAVKKANPYQNRRSIALLASSTHSSISAPIALNDKRNIYVLPYPFAATLHYH